MSETYTLGTVCELGNINGCPKYPDCKCHERMVDKVRQMNGYPPLTPLKQGDYSERDRYKSDQVRCRRQAGFLTVVFIIGIFYANKPLFAAIPLTAERETPNHVVHDPVFGFRPNDSSCLSFLPHFFSGSPQSEGKDSYQERCNYVNGVPVSVEDFSSADGVVSSEDNSREEDFWKIVCGGIGCVSLFFVSKALLE